jgi:hypothetical protein
MMHEITAAEMKPAEFLRVRFLTLIVSCRGLFVLQLIRVFFYGLVGPPPARHKHRVVYDRFGQIIE